jgi:hypothetical protein
MSTATERIDRRRHAGAHRILVADVALQRQCTTASRFDFGRNAVDRAGKFFGLATDDFDAIAMFAPSRAARSAIARPMPREAPVMKRVLPDSVVMVVLGMGRTPL